MSISISIPASLDAPSYVRPPRLGVASGLSLSKMLLLRIPKKPGPGVLMAAKALAATVVVAEASWRSQGRARPPRNARPADIRIDRAHSAMHGRLTSYELFATDHPDRVRADELLARLYPTGLGFLKLRWIEEHAESERRVQIIEEEGLREDLERLVGEAFVDELFEAHAAYGVALGITDAPEEPMREVSMIGPLRAMVRAISDYSLQVLAYAKLDPRNVPAAQRALAPIDAFRQAASRRWGGGTVAGWDDYALPEGAPAPDSPMPPVEEE